jgi:hypothetical protein
VAGKWRARRIIQTAETFARPQVCYGFDLQAASERLGGPAVQGMQAQLITQLMQQNFAPTPECVRGHEDHGGTMA